MLRKEKTAQDYRSEWRKEHTGGGHLMQDLQHKEFIDCKVMSRKSVARHCRLLVDRMSLE